MKKYYNIKEASDIVGLAEHKIRYWDSIDPKTNKLRIDGISTKSRAGTRYFNKDNINKLLNLKKLLYDYNSSFKLAEKILTGKKKSEISDEYKELSKNPENNDKFKKIVVILKKIRILLK